MNLKQWAFIDLENTGPSLKDIPTEKYDAIYIFVGSKQSNISLSPALTNKFVDVRILKIKECSKNNLDFHLSYYLGKLSSSAKKDIGFTVISNDKGFDNLIKHINTTERKCKRVAVRNEQALPSNQLLQKLLKQDSKKWPKSEKALRNYIKSHHGNNQPEEKITSIYNMFISHSKIANRIKLD